MTAAQSAMLRWGRTHCAENIVTVADGIRQRIKAVVLDYQRGLALGDPTIRESMQTRIADKFATANADWRRIAVTEASELMNQGLIASLEQGTRVRRLEQYKGACQFCRKIDGMEFEVIPASEAAGKDPWKFVWAGKTNIGRSAAPRKRVGGELVDREPHEMWIPAAGVQHPHCRGLYIALKEPASGTKLTHEDAVSRLRAKSITLLSEFKGSQKPILVRCDKHGDEYWIRAHGLVCDVKRMRCCQREDARERMTGRFVSEETRAKISAWQQDGKAPWSGKTLSEDHKAKIRHGVHVSYDAIDPFIALAKAGKTAGVKGWFYIAKMDNGLLKFGSTRFDD